MMKGNIAGGYDAQLGACKDSVDTKSDEHPVITC